MATPRLTGFVAAFLLAAPLALAGLAGADLDEECDPSPIGRCGAFQRETVVFCYITVNGQYLPATDRAAVVFGGPPPNVVSQGTGDPGLLYVRLGPMETLVADPYEAPLPFRTLFRESNQHGGLQPMPYKCANFVWFEECHPPQWMGPFQVTPKAPDEVVA